jgi:hypothetical protein
MIVEIPCKEGDDRQYLAAVCSLVASLVGRHRPDNVYVMRVKKWFDRKWLGYSGRGRIAFNGSHLTDTALDSLWQDQLTFPPFNPKQIGTQMFWRRRSDGSYGGVDKPRWIHKRQLRHSANNLNNRVVGFTDSGLFVWFTSETEKNSHGSILVYSVAGREVSAWYASFRQERSWQIDKVEGIDKSSVESCFPIK